jgi:hypothetical protein
MTLQSIAQELFVIDPISPASQLPAHDEHAVSAIPPHHPHEGKEQLMSFSPIEVTEPIEIDIIVDELPGAPHGTKDPEIEVHDESLHVEDQESTKDDKKGKTDVKDNKWDWGKHGSNGFVTWIKERLDSVPKHSGYDSAGLERAMAYMEKLDNEISKAMRMDLDSELDANQVEKIRSQLDEGLSRLQGRLEKVKDSKKSSKKRKKTAQEMNASLNQIMEHFDQSDIQSWVDDNSVPGETWSSNKVLQQLANDGQKITGVQGVFVTVPLIISRVARVCINGTVSAGHDIEDLYARQVKKYNLDIIQQAEVRQLLWDMGYPLREDRGFLPDEDIEVWDSDNMDWAANYADGHTDLRRR